MYDEVFHNLGLSYQKSGMADNAVFFYVKAIQSNLQSARSYRRLNEVLLEKHDFVKALEYAKKSCEAFPLSAEAQVNLGNVYLLLNDTLNGVFCFEKAVMLEPSNIPLKNQIKDFLTVSGFKEKAMAMDE